jgi:hypothetical protein
MVSLLTIVVCVLLVLTNAIDFGQCQFIQNLKEKIKGMFVGGSRYAYEEMMLFPNVAFQRKQGDWRLNFHGWRFRTSRRNKFFGESSSTVAERVARLFASSEQIVYYNDTFQRDRLKPFMVRDKQHEQIHLIIGQTLNTTVSTDDDGQFRTSAIMSADDVEQCRMGSSIDYRAVGDNGDQWQGKVHLLERRGLSIVSDIDDTIKVSEVLDKIRLVANTFIHGFRVVQGKLSDEYRA